MKTLISPITQSKTKVGKIAMTLVWIAVLGGLSVPAAYADRDHDNGRGGGHGGGRGHGDHDGGWRGGYRGYGGYGNGYGYGYAQPVYVPPPIYTVPMQSPGINLILPLNFR